MANEVYANGREVACKAAAGKSVCAFPDVCFTPPQTPATPPGVPIPYPNTGFASDTTDGSKTVKISGKEVMLKNKSYFKKSTGDEAGSAPKKGILTSVNRGKVFFNTWSMDVKIEGENAVRHLDLTTHNHASMPGDTPTWPYLAMMTASQAALCANDKGKEETKCKDFKPYGKKEPCPPPPTSRLSSKRSADEFADQMLEDRKGAAECLAARRCALQPYEKTKKGGCCEGQTGHHLVEASAFHIKDRGDGIPDLVTGKNVKLGGCDNYDTKKAPCICAEGAGHGVGTHGLLHTFQSAKAMDCSESGFKTSSGKVAKVAAKPGGPLKPLIHKSTNLAEAQKSGAQAVSDTFPESDCSQDCIEAQLKAYHEGKPPNGAGMNPDQQIKAVHTCKPRPKKVAEAKAKVDTRKAKFDTIQASRANVVKAR